MFSSNSYLFNIIWGYKFSKPLLYTLFVLYVTVGILLKLGEIRIGIKQKNAQVLKEAVLDLRESSAGIGRERPQTAVSVHATHHATFVAKCKCFAPLETVSQPTTPGPHQDVLNRVTTAARFPGTPPGPDLYI